MFLFPSVLPSSILPVHALSPSPSFPYTRPLYFSFRKINKFFICLMLRTSKLKVKNLSNTDHTFLTLFIKFRIKIFYYLTYIVYWVYVLSVIKVCGVT